MKNNRAESLVAITVSVALISLLLIFIIEQATKLNITQNESAAQASLKLVSAALENYSKDHQGTFPLTILALTQGTPAYLDHDYLNDSSFKGYRYDCLRLEASGYQCQAKPLHCRLSGKNIFSVTTGGVLGAVSCQIKEE